MFSMENAKPIFFCEEVYRPVLYANDKLVSTYINLLRKLFEICTNTKSCIFSI